MKIAREPFA